VKVRKVFNDPLIYRASLCICDPRCGSGRAGGMKGRKGER